MSDAISSKYFATNCTIISLKAKHQLIKEHAFSLQMVILQRKQLIATHFQANRINPRSTFSRLILSKIQENHDSLMFCWIT